VLGVVQIGPGANLTNPWANIAYPN
jgi:hypothetical protein